MGFLALVLVLALGAVIPPTLATSSWSVCDSRAYPITVQGVTVNPDPVVSGDVAEFLVPATTDQEITGGTVSITVYFHNIPVHSEKDDLCSKTPCPIQPGEFTLSNSEVLPKITPPGSYKIKLQILDVAGNVLACTYVNFEITWSWSSGLDSKTTEFPSILQHEAGEQPALRLATK